MTLTSGKSLTARNRQALRVGLGTSFAALGLFAATRALRRRPAYSFRDRSVVITGGSRGLGLELARQLGREGARLWLVARTPDALSTAAAELRLDGIRVDTIAADVRQREDIARIAERVLNASDVVDVLINNAGTIEVAPFEHTTDEDFEDSLATHFWAPLRLIRAFLPHLRRGGDGRIVNISSIGGRVAIPHLSAYAAGKFALTGLSETLRAELAKAGIAVTTVTPGILRTGSYVNVRLRGQHEDELRWFLAMGASSLTSSQADRAARRIVAAVRAGRATVSPGWQARAAHVIAAAAPDTYAAINTLADSAALPTPTAKPSGDQARVAADVDPGKVKNLMPEATRRTYRQREPAWSQAD